MGRTLLAVSGTGGHLLPAQALARDLQGDVLFMGPNLSTNRFFFKEYPYVEITAGRKPLQILKGVIQALKILRKERPRVVVGFGAYHSLPPLIAAFLLRIPIALYEPNVIPGRVNRLFSRFNVLSGQQIKVPLFHYKKVPKEEARAHFGLDPHQTTILVFGGSQGAERLKKLTLPYQLLKIETFTLDMHLAWSAADLVIARAGATTVAEHLHYEVPAIFIPYPYATDDHQTENANACDGAVTLQETELERLPEVVENCLSVLPQMKQSIIDQEKPTLELAKALFPHHFIGCNGIGMSALMHIMEEKGYPVTGSDRGTHQAQNITPLMRVVYSSAIKKDNPEYIAAKGRRIHRSDLLAELMDVQSILVAGAHGKTTTAALLAHTLIDPTYAVGGIIPSLGKNGGYGKGPYSVAEVDESDGSFLRFPAHHAILTNIEAEHLDYWKSEKVLFEAYRQFIAGVQHTLVYCGDDPHLAAWKPQGLSYGFSPSAEECITHFEEGHLSLRFSTTHYQDIAVPLIGRHNALNALAVFLIARHIGLSEAHIRERFSTFLGVKRRMEYRGRVNGVDIYDDYGHHPTEILATLTAARSQFPGRRLIAAFQPHRFTRTRDTFSLYKETFNMADEVIITDIYAAGEEPLRDISPTSILNVMQKKGTYVPYPGLPDYLQKTLREGDVLLTLGAGDITHLASKLHKQAL